MLTKEDAYRRSEIYLPEMEALSPKCYMLKCMKTTEEKTRLSKNILKMLSSFRKFERELCNFSFDRLHKAGFFQHPNARVVFY